MIHENKKKIFFILLYLLNYKNIFCVNSSVKSQDRFKSLISDKIDLTLNPINHLKSSSLFSSVISNFRKIKNSSFKKNGFKTLLIKNKAGFIRKIRIFSDHKKKPLLVFVSGLSGTANSPSFQNFAYPLLKEKKYHIVLVENSTSPEWISRNKNFLLSGCEAGLNLLYTIQAIKEMEALKGKIDYLSLVGFSLGGNDSVFASIFDKKNDENIIDGSILVWSSPFERLNSLKYLRVKSGYYRWIVNKLLFPIFQKIEVITDYFRSKDFEWFAHSGSFNEIYNNYLFKLNYENYKRLLNFYKGKDKILLDEDVYKKSYKLYSLEQYLQEVKNPTLWIHADNDRIVDNFFSIYNVYNIPQNKMDILFTPYGGHLGFYKSYGPEMMKLMIEEYVSYWGKTSYP